MPQPSPMPKRQPQVRAIGAAPTSTYAELHCRTNFTFLAAASHPDEMVQRAAELGDAALAITDRNSLAGVVRAHAAAKEVGLKLLIGAEITPTDAPPAVLLATDRAAYGRLASLITRGRRRAAKGECRLTTSPRMRSNGYSPEFAERVFKQIRGFGEYGFPESHAASFALLVYVSAWLKRYYPAAFAACVLNSQPMGFYSPDELAADASEHGVPLRPVDVNHSDWDCTLEPTDGPSPAIRLGLRMVRGLPERDARTIIAARAVGVFESFDDFARRTGLSRAGLSRLSRADAFGTLELNRRDALWNALEQREPRTLFDAVGGDAAGLHAAGHDGNGHDESGVDENDSVEPVVALPEMSRFEEVAADYRSTGLSLKGHPMQFLRPDLDRQQVTPAAGLPQIPTGRRVRVAGIVRRRQHPSSAKGVTFVTLEDETGDANLIVWPTVWERFRRVAHASRALLVTGELQHQQGVTHVIVSRMADLSERLAGIPTKSRDFR